MGNIISNAIAFVSQKVSTAIDYLGSKFQDAIASLEARLPAGLLKTLRSWWQWWQTKVPKPIRWLVYGIIIGLLVYGIVHGIGFTAAGVTAGSIAAGIHSSIGVVGAGTAFAMMQSIGTASVFTFMGISGGIGFVSGALASLAEEDDPFGSITPSPNEKERLPY